MHEDAETKVKLFLSSIICALMFLLDLLTLSLYLSEEETFFILFLTLNFFLSIFLVPGMSLGAELSSDYDERTVITSYRIMFATLVSPFVSFFGLVYFFIPEEGMSTGLLNVDAYPKFAMFCALIMVSTINSSDSTEYLSLENSFK